MGIEGCSLMRAPDALYTLCTYYTGFLFKRFQPRVGQEEVLQTQGRREGRRELDEVSDYPTSSGTGKNY